MSDEVTFADLRLPTDLVDNLGGWGITEPKKLALIVVAGQEYSTGDAGHSGLVPPETLLRLLSDTLYNHYVVAEVPRLHTSAVYRDGGSTYHLSLTASNIALESSVTISTSPKQSDPDLEFGFSFRHDTTVNPFAELQTEFGSLASRERDAVAARFGLEGEPPAPLEEIGRHLGVTRQGAFTILQRAVKRLQYPALTRLLDPLHSFVEWYSGSTLPTDSLVAQKLEKDFPAAPRPGSGWLQLLEAIRLGDVKQPEEDQAGRLLKPPSELIRVGQAAAILNVSENTVRRWETEGLLTAYRVGPRRDRRFHRTEVEQLLNRVEIENA